MDTGHLLGYWESCEASAHRPWHGSWNLQFSEGLYLAPQTSLLLHFGKSMSEACGWHLEGGAGKDRQKATECVGLWSVLVSYHPCWLVSGHRRAVEPKVLWPNL